MDYHTRDLILSAKRIAKAELNRRVAKAMTFGHGWYPNDKKPIIGVNEDSDTNRENPYVVLRNITYVHALLKEIIIREGTLTDLGSIPWLLKTIPGFRPTDPGKRMFLVHDEMYRKQLCERHVADVIMRSGLIADGMPPWQACVCYYGVRLFGGGAYEAGQRKDQA